MTGSQKMLTQFLENSLDTNPWVCLIKVACERFDVELKEANAFLGAGATGRVFEVRFKAEKRKRAALKVVLYKNRTFLEKEARALTEAKGTGVVVTLERPFTVFEEGIGAAMVLSEVGNPVNRDKLKQDDLLKLFLNLLTLHEAGFVHGDARLPNVIQHKDKYLWIDFMTVAAFSDLSRPQPAFEEDVIKLSRSVLQCSPEDLPPSVLSAISNYGSSRSRASFEELAAKVWKEYEQQRN
ncbi:hypothetical protein HDU96_006621 [Phlyctochytrium bullatum]|nr:hypothetical protein HDU96_006621 [Phlyctochytrium bullatum]